MEINEPEDAKLCKPNLGGSLDTLELAEAHSNSDSEHLNTSEALLDNLLESLEKDTTPAWSDKETQNDQIDNDSTAKNNAKDSAETEKSKSLFHLSDNMKKDLSMLAYPSKPVSRKKGVISSRAIPNSRITIAEALEKAEDARKSISSLHVTSDIPDVKEGGISKLSSQFHSYGKTVEKKYTESQDVMGLLPHNDTPETSRQIWKKMDSAVTSQSVADGSPTSDTTVNESASCSEGKTVLLAGKAKASGTSRIQMTRRMWELLKFTFIHEHFPSSVHMARLAKMMGMPWSQVRNWFTDRRVDSKKAGIYPRDRPLIDCPYCNITLQTEAEQKSHLFSTQHVKRILGSEYCGGGGTSESIKWKKLPKTVNAVSRVSGARILAVGFSAEDFKKSKRVQEKKKMEAAVPHSKELKKLWTDAMLLPEEKEQSPTEWNPVRIGVEKNVDSHCDPNVKGKNQTAFNLKTQDKKEEVSELKHHENVYDGKVVVNSRVVSIPVNVDDIIPDSVSDNLPVTANNATKTSKTVAVTSLDVDPVTASVSAVIPGDLHIKKHYQTQDTSVISEGEVPRKVAAFGKKPKNGDILEPQTESQRLTILPTEVPQKAHKGTVPNNMKPKNKSSSSTSGFVHFSNISREKKSSRSSILSSQYIQDFELKQELECDESRKNNITLYKGDGSNGESKCEMAVVNANKQPYMIGQSSALPAPNSLKNLQSQKTSLVAHDSSVVKPGSGSGVNKIYKTSIDKRKVKVRAHPLGSVLRASKMTGSAYEGNIIVGYQCPNCNKVYQTEWLMIKHSVTHFKYHCDICYQVYPTENLMKIHLLDHLSGAYEDEKYYCQFSCKICHSLKCGCYEPTYCKPQDLPRIFFRPQKAKRSKKGFISKLNSGPNDHLKISLSSYKKLLLSESLGNSTKEKSENSASPKPILVEDAQRILVLKDDQKATSRGDSQISTSVLREAQVPNAPPETPKVHTVERENLEFTSVKGETSHAILTKGRGSDSVAGISSEHLEDRPNVSALAKNLITEREKQLNWKQLIRKLTLNYKSDVIPSQQSLCLNKLEEKEDAPGTKRAVRRRMTKHSSNFIYDDTDFYYMCEICDASFSSKAGLSEHMFLHRLKSRSRRGEKRGISCVMEEKEMLKKMKMHEVQDKTDTERHSCELCHSTFPTITDYRAHKILVHKEPKPQNVEVFRCNYCDKIYRRRRELKRHLKRDCVSAPPSLKGKLSALSCSTNVIEESHYTTVKIDFDERSDMPSKPVSRSAARGPIVCKYCLAVTKREAEMKRHIWKFCLKVPSEVVKQFMDGASLEQLGFKYIRDKEFPEGSCTDKPQNTHRCISETQSTVKDSLDEIQIIKNPEVSEESSPEKHAVHLEMPGSSDSVKYSLQMSPDEKISTLQEDVSQISTSQKGTSQISSLQDFSPEHRIARKETSLVQNIFEDSETAEPSLEMDASHLEPVASEEQSMNTINSEELEESGEPAEAAEMQSPIKPLVEEAKIEPICGGDEMAHSAATTSPLASPVMQFPIVLPVMTASAKSKRPLVCGYCGIWYFREMAILKHMKERCIKIPDFEKDLLKSSNTLCSVSQKAGGVGIASDNGAVYKMVKVPEHMQNTPVPMPKEISNEDIKELNTKITAYSESTSTEAKSVNEQEMISSSSSSSVSPPVNQTRSTSSKRGSRCRRCHEHFSSQDAVLAHSSVHHGPKKGFYKCKLCHARLAKYKQLREHVWEHTNENPYRCHLCEVKYRSSDALVEHLQTQHQYTSINEKNLYKWLPGRHGKYRDIKTKNSNCEEKLEDVDTNLDSLAEVMVITDKDICSNTTSEAVPKKEENTMTKNCSGMHKHFDDSENIKEKNDNLELDSTCDKENSSKSNCKSNETKAAPASSDVNNRICTVNSDLSKDIIADKTDNLGEGDTNTMEKSSGMIFDGSPSVKNTAVQEQSEYKEGTSTEPCTKSESGLKEQSEATIMEGTRVDRDTESGVVDCFTGEGLLPLVGNLDSVVETVHLTDKHLS